jgi:two-component system sensor kinase FixL
MSIKNITPPDLLSSYSSSLHSQYGFFEWYIQEERITFCPHMAEIIAFETKNITQNYDAWARLTHSDDVKQIKLSIERIKSGETPYVISESRKFCRDGVWRWFSVRGKIIDFDEAGNPMRAVGTCTDISKIKEAELQLEQTQFLFNENNRIKDCYKKGLSLNELCAEILKSFVVLTNSTDPLLIFSSVNNAKTKKIEFTNTNDPALYNLNKDDSNKLMSDPEKLKFVNKMLNAKTHSIQNDEKTSLLGILFDLPLQQKAIAIIEREEPFDDELLNLLEPLIGTATHIISIKRLQANSSELDNILSFFIQQVPAPLAMFDNNMCYKFASDAWRKEFKKAETSYNIIGKSHYEVNPKQPGEWREHHQRALSGETLKFEPTEIIDYLDEPFWAEGAVHPWYTLNGEIGGVIVYSNVVTERKENENRLNTTVENLIRSNQSLERFAHVCSHDLKEPLRSISNFIQLLFGRNSEHFDEESLIYMRHTLKGIDRMNSLIKDILLYSKITGQTTSTKIPLDLNRILYDIKETFDYNLSKIDACLNISELPTVLGEPTQIDQLFTNLVENAIKFRSDKPLVIDIFTVEKTLFWEIHMRDNGIGINEEYHKSIFTMFKRLHGKSQYEGSGIGLAICQKIVHEHFGKIYVKSVPEGGSDFVFTLPKTLVYFVSNINGKYMNGKESQEKRFIHQ